eukprot:TRINITY_DN6505_c0_g1_i7.p1 TRINITY_DN6505_c0_g1~~TRINITY_DN6505_c0_g1_i7.p1  ORF type:complete len:180 (+),score=2.06 TRINITY_DN6505_c0_g1_i7:147-686(+)
MSLDLSSLTGLKSLGSFFLYDTPLEELHLPASVEVVGEGFLSSGFTEKSKKTNSRYPSRSACRYPSRSSRYRSRRSFEVIRSLDLSSLTGLRSLGSNFLSDTEQLEKLRLPASVEVVGDWGRLCFIQRDQVLGPVLFDGAEEPGKQLSIRHGAAGEAARGSGIRSLDLSSLTGLSACVC